MFKAAVKVQPSVTLGQSPVLNTPEKVNFLLILNGESKVFKKNKSAITISAATFGFSGSPHPYLSSINCTCSQFHTISRIPTNPSLHEHNLQSWVHIARSNIVLCNCSKPNPTIVKASHPTQHK